MAKRIPQAIRSRAGRKTDRRVDVEEVLWVITLLNLGRESRGFTKSVIILHSL
jgi:hypothetical protein